MTTLDYLAPRLNAGDADLDSSNWLPLCSCSTFVFVDQDGHLQISRRMLIVSQGCHLLRLLWKGKEAKVLAPEASCLHLLAGGASIDLVVHVDLTEVLLRVRQSLHLKHPDLQWVLCPPAICGVRDESGIYVSSVSTCDPLGVEASFLGWQSIRPSHVGSAVTDLGFSLYFEFNTILGDNKYLNTWHEK